MLKTTTIGDMSRHFGLQHQTTSLKSALEKLSFEVTTGRTVDPAKAVKGDFLSLNSVESSLTRMTMYQSHLAELELFAETGQRALETVQDRALSTGTNLITVSQSAELTVVSAVTRDARQTLETVVSALNVQAAGRTVFAGMATNMPALADAETIVADLVVATTGALTAQDVIDAVTDWFDSPLGGFETLGYQGSLNKLSPFDLGLGETTNFNFAADDQEIRNVLKGFAMAAVLDEGLPGLNSSERTLLVRAAGEQLLTGEKQMAQYRANVGTTEAAISNANVRTSSEIAALNLARSDILGIDQYAAAGALEATQVQLEMLYSLTARMSRLNLMEFLR